jgi:TonB family protein
MTQRLIAFVLLSFLGCSASQELNRGIAPPELITYVPLPPIRIPLDNRPLKLKVMMYVRGDGSVEHVRFLQSSGDPSWDSLAVQKIMQWRYAPPLRNGVPTDVWVSQNIVVQFGEPILMSLLYISAPDKRQADSLYALLSKGSDFETLMKDFARHPPNQSGGSLGTVDIRNFAPRVRDTLKGLKEGEFTPPLRSGDRYVIYKRLKMVVS